MTPATGQTLRRLGLLVEAVCLLGLLSLARGNVGLVRAGWPLDPSVLLAAGLAVGFTLWLTGTLAIYWPRRDRSRRADE
jgi:hypothetical protein